MCVPSTCLALAFALAFALAACGEPMPSDAGPTPSADAGGADAGGSDAGGEDGGPPLGCTTAAAGFPRPLGLPEPEPNGVFDPDLVRDPASGRLYMAHSAVAGRLGTSQVSTHLSYSDDDGATWCYAGAINPSEAVPLDELPAGIAGTRAHWSHETSAIVHDPAADPSERWRLLWHRYLHVDEPGVADSRRFLYGWIAQRTASTAEGLLSAPEQKLFSSVAYYVDPAVTAYNDAAPGGLPAQRLDAVPGLSDCLLFTEPGLIAHDGELYLAMFCARTATETDIELLRLDRASDEWSHVGELLTHTDASTIDPSYEGFNAPDLFAFEGGHRMLLTPISMDRYRGCIAFEVDLATATVRDDAGDGPDALFTLPLGDSMAAPFGGACTFLEGSTLGLVYGEVRPATVPEFTLTATGNQTL